MRGLVIVWLSLAGCGSQIEQKMVDAPPMSTACTTEADCSAPTPYCEPTAGVCVACRFDSHCNNGVCDTATNACRMAKSCKELHAALPGLPNGSYPVDHDGAGPKPELDVYCDMTTAGGGWTALLNPDSIAANKHPDLVANTTTLSGTQSCEGSTVPGPFTANGFHGFVSYACGTVTFELAMLWPNAIGATDVMFLATLQGQSTRTLTINGTAVTADATANDPGGAVCAFYNATSASTAPSNNGCYALSLNATPHVGAGLVTGDLSMAIRTGAACEPDCNHGTGMNIQKLFVR